ncbi:MAG: Gfo/Idh/MocA family oxidoreductase [Candidatus Brockarchaeota archaeon]|nr:Gfo/Idh/MocA family oxidoreductase [Candidatus Brockarchaeota archaeon]
MRIGIIGTGKRKEEGDETGYGMAHYHAKAYMDLGNCRIVACADIVRENAEAFAKAYDVPKIYSDYNEMLSRENLDIVSVCTWPRLHSRMVVDCARAGVRAVHCEKPMADTWGGAKLMFEECEKRGVQLTFNHQRRFGKPFRVARELLKAGEIGQLERLEGSCGDIYDYGTHYVDMFGFYNDEVQAEWVIGQVDYSREKLVFGAPVENHGVFLWKYKNGVFGFMGTGDAMGAVGAHNRIVGTEGVIEVGAPDGSDLRVRRKGSARWEVMDTHGEGLHGPGYIERAIADAVDALQTGREPELSARKALNATEIIFACYESSRRRAVVRLPLDVDDNPLAEMIKSGVFSRKEP